MERPSAAHGADVGALGLTMAASSAAMCLCNFLGTAMLRGPTNYL